MSKAGSHIDVAFRIWFFTEGEKLLGKGRVELLERIDRSGSISHAAREMKMSYRQAWQMVTEMNARGKMQIVDKKLGGKQGGGALLTPYGRELVATFHKIEMRTKDFLEKELGRYGL